MEEEQIKEIDWSKINKAIETALEAPLPQVAIHHLIDRIIKAGVPTKRSEATKRDLTQR